MSAQPITEPERLVLLPAEVAKMLGVRRSTVYKLAREGDLPHKVFGRRIVIPREAFYEWLNRTPNAASDVEAAR